MGLELSTLPFTTPVIMVVFVHTCVLQCVFFFRRRFQIVAGMEKYNCASCLVGSQRAQNRSLIADTQYPVICYLLDDEKHNTKINFFSKTSVLNTYRQSLLSKNWHKCKDTSDCISEVLPSNRIAYACCLAMTSCMHFQA